MSELLNTGTPIFDSSNLIFEPTYTIELDDNSNKLDARDLTKDSVIYGKEGKDNIIGTLNNDLIFGQEDNDNLSGSLGDDILSGGSGDDELYGQKGKDILFGGSGNDTLIGGDGNDLLITSLSEDTLTGGKGKDTFQLTLKGVQSVDTITDFDIDEDILEIKQTILGKDIERITPSIFRNVESLENIEVSKGVIYYESNSGMLYFGEKPLVQLSKGLDLKAGDIRVVE